MTKWTPDDYEAATGEKPTRDDLERANCGQAGKPMHSQCGVCETHRKPRFICGCRTWPVGHDR